MRTRLLAAVIPTLAVLLCASGCGQNGTNAGLTNGPPPAAGEKAAQRNDLPGSIAPSPGEPVGQLGDTTTNSGTAGAGGGTEGGKPIGSKSGASADPDSVRATPPVKAGGDRNSAAGGTKPPEPIQTGTPRSPQ